MEKIPAIDVLKGQVVRLRQGRFDAARVYGGNPVQWAQLFRRHGAASVHLVFLDAARTGAPPDLSPVEAIREVGLAVEVAGGIRTPEVAADVLHRGAVRVVVGSAADDPARLREILSVTGPDRLAVALDARSGALRIQGWETASAWTLEGRLAALAEEGIRRILYTDVERDGTLGGPDLETASRLAKGVFHSTVAGGVSSAQDIAALAAVGVDAVILGRSLYEGTVPLESLGAS